MEGVQTQAPLDPSDLLREHGVQITAQRLAILRAISGTPHSIADNVTEDVRAEIGAIPRQTVYDAFGTLVDKGILRRVQPAGSSARYEQRADDNHHLVCRSCGHIQDIDCSVGSAPCLHAANDHGLAIDEAEVSYWGKCPACREESI